MRAEFLFLCFPVKYSGKKKKNVICEYDYTYVG